MFLASGLSVGGGGIAGGRAGREQAGTQGLSLEIWGPAGGGPTGKGTWVPRLERRANASCLAVSPGSPHLFLLPLCAPIPKGTTSKLQTPPLSGLVPPTLFPSAPRSPGPLSPEPCSPVPCRRLLKGGQRRSPCTTHQRRGSARGWATQAASSAASWQQPQPSQSSRCPQAGAQPRRQGSV